MSQTLASFIVAAMLLVSITNCFAADYDDLAEFYRNRGLVLVEGLQAGRYSESHYVIVNNLNISSGTKMEIAPGSIVYLAHDAIVVVNGELVARNVDFKPLPADFYDDMPVSKPWGGILIGSSGLVDTSGANIESSLYGVHSLALQAITVQSEPLTICDKKQDLRRLIVPSAATLVFTGLFAYDMQQRSNYLAKYRVAEIDKIEMHKKSAANATTQAIVHGVLGLISLGITGWVGYTILF